MAATPVPFFGHKTFMQMGTFETTYGTYNAPSGAYKFRLDVLQYNLVPQVGVVRDKSLGGFMAIRNAYQGPIYYKGTIDVKVNYEGMKEILRGLFGTYVSSGAALPAPAIDDVFTDGLTLHSYSLEMGYGGAAGGSVFHLLGTKFIGATFKGQGSTGDDGMLTCSLQVIVQDIDTNAGAGYSPSATLSYAGQFPSFFGQAVIVDDGSTDLQSAIGVTGFEVTYESPHIEDRLWLGGGVLIQEPIRDNFITAKFKLTQEFSTMTQWLNARNFTTGSPRLVFQHPTALTTLTLSGLNNVASGGVSVVTRGAGSFTTDGVKVGHYLVAPGTFPAGTYVVTPGTTSMTVANNFGGSLAAMVNGNITFTTNREFELRCGTAKLIDLPQPIDKWGRLMTTATWEALYDPTDVASLYCRIRGSEVVLP